MGLTWKILLFTSALVIGLMLAILGLTSTQAAGMATESARQHLAGAAQSWDAFRAEQLERLQLGVRVLGNDPAFKAAVQTEDPATVHDLLVERGKDLGADFFVATDANGVVIARSDVERAPHADLSTEPVIRAVLAGTDAPVGAAWRQGTALFQAVAAPMQFGDEIVGVLVAGYRIDEALAARVGHLTGGEILFVSHGPRGEGPAIAAAASDHDAIAASLAGALAGASVGSPFEISVAREGHLALRLPLRSASGEAVGSLVILRSLELERAWLGRFRRTVAIVSFGVLAVALGLAFAASSRITGPLRTLVAAVDQARDGTVSGPVAVRSADEIGSLASAFNRMQEAIAQREGEIQRMALQDPVTMLANRALFADRLEHAFSLARRGNAPLTILLVDLARFRDVNDSLGHAAGDGVLREVGLRLRSVLRTSDTVARLASDEFAILLPSSNADEGRRVARKIELELQPPIDVGQPLHVRGNIGIASSPQHGEDPPTLLRHADLALQVARRNGTGFAVYHPDYGEGGQDRLPLVEELHRAIENGELVVHYQPKVDLRTGSLVAVEALVRWQHPTRGLLSPARFVPLAEQTGLIRAVTRSVLQQVVAQIGAWKRSGIELEAAINVSARDLVGRELPDLVRALLKEHRVDPGAIWLELTESSVMEDPAHSVALLSRMREMGLQLSIDDFGTGYSSLAYLKRLPVNELKIDKSFVSGVTSDSDDATIVRTTVELGHTMGLRVVAEGVESAEAWEALAAMGCDLAQGYHVSAPLPAADLERFARARLAPVPVRHM